MTTQLKTVGDLVADLLKMPQGLPVVVTCHYDNDDGLRVPTRVAVDHILHSEAGFYVDWDPSDPAGFPAVVVG